MMFRRKKEQKADAKRVVLRNPLAVIPIVSPHIEYRTDSKGLVHLRYKVCVTGIPGKLVRLFGGVEERFRYVELDETGSLFFSLLDGERTVNDIISTMTDRLGKDRDDVEKRVVTFIRQLMARQIIQLIVTPQSIEVNPA